jgi:Holliday junction resolvase
MWCLCAFRAPASGDEKDMVDIILKDKDTIVLLRIEKPIHLYYQ